MNNSIDDLQPCPFCGSTLVALVGMVVRCGKCCATGPFGSTREDAVLRWNGRADEPEAQESEALPVDSEL